MTLPRDSSPSEKCTPSNAVGMEGKVLNTSLPSIPSRKGVYLLGSKVSVWAMPPAIKSQITESAVDGIRGSRFQLHDDMSPATGAPAAIVAIEAADSFLRNVRLFCLEAIFR